MNEQELARVRAVKESFEQELLNKPNVIGVGIGLRRKGGKLTDELSIVVSVTNKARPDALQPDDLIPTELGGVPVDVQEIGTLRAL